MLSYAQNGEDVVLDRAFGHQNSGFYVDIGACHPLDDSVTLHFYNRGWHGVNVEPDDVLFTSFVEDRPRDTNINAAVGRSRGRITFNPTGTRGHGTLDPKLAAGRSNGRTPKHVPVVTLSDVIDCYGPEDGRIDFLKIDVEGWEAEVIASGDWVRHRPRVLVIEAVNDAGESNHEAWEPILLEAGYRYALYDGLNRFYCRHEDADELLTRLAAPANVRDTWRRASDAAAHEKNVRVNVERVAALQQKAAAEERAEALGADLEVARAAAVAAEKRSDSSAAQLEESRADLASARARREALDVAVTRAECKAAMAHNREEVAEASLAAQETAAARLRADVAALEDQLLKHAADAREQLLQHAQHLNATVAALHASTSWKISRPLRALSRLLRGSR